MARDFIAASLEKLTDTSSAIVSAVPFSLGCWFINDLDVDHVLIGVGDATTNANNYHVLQYIASGDTLNASTRETTLVHAVSTGMVTASVWTHGLGVWASTTSRQVYLDGVAGTENTTSKTTTFDQFAIGAGRRTAGNFSYHDGAVAEAAAWSVALSQADAAQLAVGVSPLLVRPDKLLAYWPLYGRYDPEIDLIGGNNLALVNTPGIRDHPAIIKPSAQILQFSPVAPVAGGLRAGTLGLTGIGI